MTAPTAAALAKDSEAATQAHVLGFLDASGFKRIDTHASVVFLGGNRVLKIKRAVKLPFLDYSTLEKRRLACEEELMVNAGNAPEIYRGVVAITRGGDGGLAIGGAGVPVEWAVEMARFDETQTLDHIAAANAIDQPLALAMADTILLAHDKAPRAGGETWLDSIPEIIDRNTDKFHAVRGLDAAAIDRLDATSHDYVKRLQTLLSRRVKQGFVRRCHGDLHLANIALVNGRPLLFDAIEFDPSIATTDILYDLAFTLMDLVHFGALHAANALFNRYLSGAEDDLDGLGLLPLFLSMRAAIRAHVLFTRSEQAAHGEAAWQEAKRYFDLAGRLIKPEPPRLIAIGGLSGTGKSVLARELAGLIGPPPGAVMIRSDVVRKRLFGVSETMTLPETAYRAATTKRVYDLLSSTAERILAQGCSVVLDAAFIQEMERTAVPDIARKQNAAFSGLFLTADLATRMARIERRQGDASDATREVAVMQETFATGHVEWQMVDASGAPGDTLRRACAGVPGLAPAVGR
ncbi:AAA family ATPase [Bradyrhizobium sp. KBS0727]|uniref:bifunctional aminoglycoside phosphotransferase/ATP-binding protein n=1 Tax=unclassified Bradyrhizobium TaxID=2631580 RepID=UPI00110D4578|nr:MULTISPECIES: bifunctional aminoglycoside phosphotransferase/ATP-binding protein [unclassified Bradyrhizobium]QDW38847.1 AAA family ATPase [Bradyrhizobium sp. KBS0725]QDW45450.1 AAA family ATPase [Bradyrhizobium sp. KBS0727]